MAVRASLPQHSRPACAAQLPRVGLFSLLTQPFVILFSKLIPEDNLSLQLSNARIVRTPM